MKDWCWPVRTPAQPRAKPGVVWIISQSSHCRTIKTTTRWYPHCGSPFPHRMLDDFQVQHLADMIETQKDGSYNIPGYLAPAGEALQWSGMSMAPTVRTSLCQRVPEYISDTVCMCLACLSDPHGSKAGLFETGHPFSRSFLGSDEAKRHLRCCSHGLPPMHAHTRTHIHTHTHTHTHTQKTTTTSHYPCAGITTVVMGRCSPVIGS
jgi:hypothetical protein